MLNNLKINNFKSLYNKLLITFICLGASNVMSQKIVVIEVVEPQYIPTRGQVNRVSQQYMGQQPSANFNRIPIQRPYQNTNINSNNYLNPIKPNWNYQNSYSYMPGSNGQQQPSNSYNPYWNVQGNRQPSNGYNNNQHYTGNVRVQPMYPQNPTWNMKNPQLYYPQNQQSQRPNGANNNSPYPQQPNVQPPWSSNQGLITQTVKNPLSLPQPMQQQPAAKFPPNPPSYPQSNSGSLITKQVKDPLSQHIPPTTNTHIASNEGSQMSPSQPLPSNPPNFPQSNSGSLITAQVKDPLSQHKPPTSNTNIATNEGGQVSASQPVQQVPTPPTESPPTKETIPEVIANPNTPNNNAEDNEDAPLLIDIRSSP